MVDEEVKKSVRFFDEVLQTAKESKAGFAPDFIMLMIDKFFNVELNVVIQPLDNEFQEFLEQEKKESMELEQTINELDDFFFKATELD